MREFGPKISSQRRQEIVDVVESLYRPFEPKREVLASAFAMEEDPDRVVVHEADVRFEEGRYRIAATEPSARPPFEWLYELSCDVGEIDYFKHYLVTADDIVLAQRKVLTPIDDTEADLILSDLEISRPAFEDGAR